MRQLQGWSNFLFFKFYYCFSFILIFVFNFSSIDDNFSTHQNFQFWIWPSWDTRHRNPSCGKNKGITFTITRTHSNGDIIQAKCNATPLEGENEIEDCLSTFNSFNIKNQLNEAFIITRRSLHKRGNYRGAYRELLNDVHYKAAMKTRQTTAKSIKSLGNDYERHKMISI